MEASPDIRFRDLKNEERYKRLERNLKVALVKQVEKLKTNDNKNYCTSPNWPSASSIHSEVPDTSAAVNNRSSLHLSRIESDVVSSSTNLRKIFPVIKNHGVETIVTSSVKKFSDTDRPLMPPPPPSCTQRFQSTKRPLKCNLKYNEQDEHNKIQELDIMAFDTSKRITCSSEVAENNIIVPLQNSDYKNCRVFYRWRVILNDLGQLLIKGTLECGKVARSKPVCQRLASNKVQSVFKHIYFLDGSLVDDKYELPDYVRGKFYNGFPDDWENVYQLWRNFVSEGSAITFRWPTRITDSDDDLNSEATEVTFSKSKPVESKEQSKFSKNAIKKSALLDYNSKPKSNNYLHLENSKENNVSYLSPKTHITKKKLDDSGHSSEIKYISTSNTECIANNSCKSSNTRNTQCLKSDVKNDSYLFEIIQEDKLRIILSNLGDKNLPPEYVDKFIELVNCLKYILSYKPSNDCEKNNKNESSTPCSNQIQSCQKCNSVPSILEGKETVTEMQCNIPNSKTQPEIKNSLDPTINCVRTNLSNSNKDESISSNSDTCMGVPKLNLNHLLTSKLKRRTQCKNLKYRNKNKNTNANNQFQEQNSFQHHKLDNSCISISESECKSYEEQYQQFKKQRLTRNSNINQDYVKTSNNANNIGSAPANIAQKINNKPTIKKCEQVYFNLKLKNGVKTDDKCTDISINNEVTPEKNVSSLNHNINNNELNKSDNDEKLSKEILQHPFLTYDSEDFENDEELDMHRKLQNDNLNNRTKHNESMKNILSRTPELNASSEMKRMPLNNKIINNEPFGSKKNPKLLTSWVPFVYHDKVHNQYNLTFKGKLLNEAGHILNRKYITDPVYHRHSVKLIETIHNDFFLLVGELANKNYDVPKHLLKQCYAGCPVNIKPFCEKWIKFSADDKEVISDNKTADTIVNTSINDLAVQTSLLRRQTGPPLNYCQGEKLLSKEFDIVYNSGNMKESSLIQKSEELKKSLILKKSSNTKNTPVKIIKSPTKRFKTDNASPKAIRRRTIKKRILNYSESSCSSSGNESNSDYIPRPKYIKVPNAYTQKLRSRKQNPLRLEAYDTRSKSTKGPKKYVWTYGKEEYVDNLSDDLASVR